ncbi:hypothetical protein BV898_17876 [Hypsibius exemplaris]|uniref:Geminin n=1 Tax=Hypsibius exemplaris TaxID=2072580 RepID=A0A9X6RMG3_HYPEX|nr:hypothetical protein BV898_17876 [Hypsibius exemplaris]
MLARRPLQALPLTGGHSRELNVTPKSAKDPNVMLKTPLDAGKPRKIALMKNMAPNVAVQQSRTLYSRREMRETPPSGMTVKKPASKLRSTKIVQQPQQPTTSGLPFAIFEDAPVAVMKKKSADENAENIRPSAEAAVGRDNNGGGQKRQRKALSPIGPLVLQEEPMSLTVDEQIGWMTAKPGKESPLYWKVLAEERRLALMEALEENKKLHAALKVLKTNFSDVEAVAGQAEYFARVVSNMLDKDAVVSHECEVQTDINSLDFEEAALHSSPYLL